MDDLDRFRREWLEEVAWRKRPHKPSDSPESTQPSNGTKSTSLTAQSRLVDEYESKDDKEISNIVSKTEKIALSEKPPPTAQSSQKFLPPSSTLDRDAIFSFHAGAEASIEATVNFTKTQTEAVTIFESAVEKEHTGKLADAVALYRDAFKVDENVDKLYREKWFGHYKSTANASGTKAAIAAKIEELENIQQRRKKQRELNKKLKKENIDPSTLTLEERKKLYMEEEENLEEAAADEDLLTKEGEMESYNDLSITPLDENLPSFFSALPIEIITRIVIDLALADLPSFRSIMSTCRLFHGVGMGSQSIWKALAMREYPFQHYIPSALNELLGTEKTPETENSDSDADEETIFELRGRTLSSLKGAALEHFRDQQESSILWNPETPWHGSWRRMYLQRPRARFDGIYISTCNYMRPGRSEGWNQPVIMVTYYRYLRFFKDGTCLSFLTTDEPRDVVPVFVKQKALEGRARNRRDKEVYTVTRSDGTIVSRPSGIVNGKWVHANGQGQLLLQTEGSVEDHTFYMRLDIRSSGRHRHNKLRWNEFWTIKRDGTRFPFNLRHDKPFYFLLYRYS